MKIFTKKSFMRKIAIICLFLILFNFSGVNQVQAANDDSNWGGKLLGSTMSLFVAVADGIYSTVNGFIMGNNYFDSLVEVSTTTSFWAKLGMFVLAAIGTIVGIITGSIIVAIIAAGSAYLIASWAGSIMGNRELISGEQITGETTEQGVHQVFRGVIYKEDALPDMLYLPFFSLHLGAIFAGDILLFDVNFFENKEPKEHIDSQGNKLYYMDKNNNGTYEDNIDVITSKTSASSQLRGIVSSWYYRLRAIAIIASMLVLIYIGIRITFSSLNPNGKAKYKNMLMDWIVSVCLIFCMHYIMLFSVKLVEYVTDFINSTSNEGGTYLVMMEPSDVMKENLKDLGFDPNGDYFVDGTEVRIKRKGIFIPN